MNRTGKPSLAGRFAAMSRRERGIILVAGIVSIAMLGTVYGVDPQKARLKRTADALQSARTTELQLKEQSSALSRTLAQDLNAEPRVRVEELKKKVAALDDNLRVLHKGLVPPEHMGALLEDMLNRNARLKLLALRTLPVAPLVDDAKPAVDAKGKPQIAADKTPEKAAEKVALASAPRRVFKHGVELTVQGSYHELLAYLGQLERLPVQMFWSDTRLDAKDYPRVKLTLKLFTLSLDETWLVL
jgi:MSHA biogenesis protein MshJ